MKEVRYAVITLQGASLLPTEDHETEMITAVVSCHSRLLGANTI